MTYTDALLALSTGRFVPAIATFLGHVAFDRTDGEAWLYLGIGYSESGLLTDALHALHVAELLLEEDAELSEAFGVTYLRLGELDTAGTHLRRALAADNPPQSIHRNLAVLYLLQRGLDVALQSINRAIAGEPANVVNRYVKTLILRELHNRDQRDYRFELKGELKQILATNEVPPQIASFAKEELSTLF